MDAAFPVFRFMAAEAVLGDAGWEDLSGRWAGAVESMMEDCLPIVGEARRDEILRSMTKGADPSGYVFRCVVCANFVGRWDCS